MTKREMNPGKLIELRKLPDSGPRKRATKVRGFSLTDSEVALINAMAELLNTSRSAVVRQAIAAYAGTLSVILKKEV